MLRLSFDCRFGSEMATTMKPSMAKPIVKTAKMSEEMQNKAFEVASEAIAANASEKVGFGDGRWLGPARMQHTRGRFSA